MANKKITVSKTTRRLVIQENVAAYLFLLPFLLLINNQGLNCVKAFKLYRSEQMAELQAEKDALEAQRKQSEAMMAQLMAMQQQMQNTAAVQQPAPQETQPDMAAMMAELQALRAQLASQSTAEEKKAELENQ